MKNSLNSFVRRLKGRFFAFFSKDINQSMTLDERNKLSAILASKDFDTIKLHNFALSKKVTDHTYSNLHKQYGYSTNNWAFDLLNEPEILNAQRYFEFGAGNGAFMEFLRAKGKNVAGVDLINPRALSEIIKGDYEDAFSSPNLLNAEIIYSADFLEHLDFSQLEDFLSRCTSFKKQHLHVIACYDDNISHKTVMSPYAWGILFSRFFSNVEIRRVYHRRYPGKKLTSIFFCSK